MKDRLHGLGLIELVIITAIFALILSIAVPQLRQMKRENEYSKVEGDLETLKVAVTSYSRYNQKVFPSNIHQSLRSSKPIIVAEALTDPWVTDPNTLSYGYTMGSDSRFGNYFIIYTQGPEADTVPSFNTIKQQVEYSGSGHVVSNAPVKKH